MKDFNGFEIFFVVCAAIGGAFVLLRLVLMFLGVGTDLDGDVDLDIDGAHVDSDVGFQVLSIHSLTSFLMMFGLVGLALYRQTGVSFLTAIGGASAAGIVSLWVIPPTFLPAHTPWKRWSAVVSFRKCSTAGSRRSTFVPRWLPC